MAKAPNCVADLPVLTVGYWVVVRACLLVFQREVLLCGTFSRWIPENVQVTGILYTDVASRA